MTESDPPTVIRFVGVYNAEHTLRGELAYWFGKRLGTAHCGLCDITHGTFRERADWRSCRSTLPVPFDTFHLDDQPDEIRHLTEDTAPAVIADTVDGPILLLGPDALDACAASPELLAERLLATVAERGLRFA